MKKITYIILLTLVVVGGYITYDNIPKKPFINLKQTDLIAIDVCYGKKRCEQISKDDQKEIVGLLNEIEITRKDNSYKYRDGGTIVYAFILHYLDGSTAYVRSINPYFVINGRGYICNSYYELNEMCHIYSKYLELYLDKNK